MNTDISEYLASGRSIREAPPGIATGAGVIRLRKVLDPVSGKYEEPELRPAQAITVPRPPKSMF